MIDVCERNASLQLVETKFYRHVSGHVSDRNEDIRVELDTFRIIDKREDGKQQWMDGAELSAQDPWLGTARNSCSKNTNRLNV